MSRSRYTLLINSFIDSLKKIQGLFQSVSRTCASGVSYYISSSCLEKIYSWFGLLRFGMVWFGLVWDKIQLKLLWKELTYFMLKSCFKSVLVLMDFNLMFMHFSSLWGANDLFSMKIMNQPIRADFATIGWKSSILNLTLVSSIIRD